MLGYVGQNIVCKWLSSKNVKFWVNDAANFNITDIVMERDCKLTFLEVNTKPFYLYNGVETTGKNKRTIENYMNRSYLTKTDYYMIFVDVLKGAVYGQYLSKLFKSEYYTIKSNEDILLFKISGMDSLFDLSVEDITLLNKYSKKKNVQQKINF